MRVQDVGNSELHVGCDGLAQASEGIYEGTLKQLYNIVLRGIIRLYFLYETLRQKVEKTPPCYLGIKIPFVNLCMLSNLFPRHLPNGCGKALSTRGCRVGGPSWA